MLLMLLGICPQHNQIEGSKVMSALKGMACYLFAVWIEHILSCESVTRCVTRYVTATSSPTISVFTTASSAMAVTSK
jgi:hypothetical protein